MVNTKISQAFICDGSGSPGFQGDILIQEGKISDIGQFPRVEAQETIQAEGMIATPGFVDVHRHLEFQALENPQFGQIELAQGITTAVGGNCGFAPYPCRTETQRGWYDFIAPCLGIPQSMTLYPSFSQYAQGIEENPRHINVGGLAALGAIKVCSKGFSKTQFSQEEMEQVQGLLCESLEEGALGISCGIMYTPECHTTKEEYIQWLKPASKYGKTFTSHIRGEGNSLLSSVEEVIDIAKQAGLPLNISHLKSVGKANWKKTIYQVAEVIEREREQNNEITADFYPYTGGSTTLLSVLPPSFLGEQLQETLDKLASPTGKTNLKKEIQKEHPLWDNMVLDIGYEQIILSGVTLEKNKVLQGRSIEEISVEKNLHPVDFLADLLVEEQGQVSVIVMSMCQEDVDFIASLPYTSLISDALYGTMTSPHPRLLASFPKFLRSYVRERKLLSLEEAVRKMTSMPAQRFGIPGRGVLEKGAVADLNLFSLEKIQDNATFQSEPLLATGISKTFLAGSLAMADSVANTPRGAIIKTIMNKG